MKTINKFLEEAHLFKVFLCGWLFFGSVAFCLFVLLTEIPDPEQFDYIKPISTIINIKIGAGIGFVFGLLFMITTSMARKSDKFWNYSKIVEDAVKLAKTKSELKSVYDDELQTLRRMSLGGPQNYKVQEISTIINTKYQGFNIIEKEN